MNSIKPNVVSGQQIGLLGGPLYTTYKIIGALRYAEEINGNAIYWLETNDADFNEINHFEFLDDRNQLRKLTWDIPSNGFSCGYIEVDNNLVELLTMFFDSIRQTEFTPGLRKMVLDCYSSGRTLAEASVMLAKELFSDFNLTYFTPFDPQFRDFSQKILFNEAERTADGDQCNLFCMTGKQRKPLFKKGNTYTFRDGTPVDITQHTLVPHVKTRSICQDAYFNTHTYIAGPGEVAYLSELGPNYAFHNVKQASVKPRMSLYLLEPRTIRLMKKTNLTLEEITETPKPELIKKVFKNETQFDFDKLVNTTSILTTEFLAKLEEAGIHTDDMKAVRRTITETIKTACGKTRSREKEKNQLFIDMASFLSDALLPFDKPQERVFNVFYYMNLFGGKDFIKKLYDIHDFNKKILELGA